MLELSPQPEVLIPLIPEAEFCFTVKSVGINDATMPFIGSLELEGLRRGMNSLITSYQDLVLWLDLGASINAIQYDPPLISLYRQTPTIEDVDGTRFASEREHGKTDGRDPGRVGDDRAQHELPPAHHPPHHRAIH